MGTVADAIMTARRAREQAPAGTTPTARGKGGGKGAPTDVMPVLVREVLHGRADLTNLMNSKTVVLVTKDDTHSSSVQGMSDWWHEQKKENDKAGGAAGAKKARTDAGGAGNTLPYKKLFMHGVWLNEVKARCAAIMQAHGAKPFPVDPGPAITQVQKAITALEQIPDTEIDIGVGSLRSRFNSFKAGKPWKWELQLTDFACAALLENWKIIVQQFQDPEAKMLIEMRRQYQSEAEQQLWAYLRAR